MTDQVRIGDDGQLEIERTWDGEPLWSVETQQDELFAGDAFKQMPGQLPIEEEPFKVAPIDWRARYDDYVNERLRFRFIPDQGPATSFNANSIEDAQRFAAEHLHGQPGAIVQVAL